MSDNKDKKNINIIFSKATPLRRNLDSMKRRFTAKSEPDDLIVPYILMTAATLEAHLNELIEQNVRGEWKENSKELIDAYLGTSFRGKLYLLAPLLTSNQYRINHEHWVFKRLFSLISVRNLLVHAKPKKTEIEGFRYEHPLYGEMYLPRDDIKDIEKLLEKPLVFSPIEYHEAYEKLIKWFINKNKSNLKTAALVRPKISISN